MDLIFEIDHLASALAFVGILLVAAKWITKRLAAGKADSFFLKLHKPAGYLTAIAGMTHMVCAVRAVAMTPVWVYIFGTLSIVLIILAICAYRRNTSKWLFWHRVFSAAAMISIVMHWLLRG